MFNSKKFELSLPNLPSEIILLIFRYIPSKECLKLRLVCQQWKSEVESSHILRKHLHLQISGWNVTPEKIAFLEKTTTSFHQLSLIQAEFHHLPQRAWKSIGPNLKVLSFRYCVKIRLQDFHEMLKLCPKLQELQTFDHFPPLGHGYRFETYLTFTWPVSQITKVEMYRATAVDDNKFTHFLCGMKELEYLRVESYSLKKMERAILDVVREKTDTLRSLFLVDNNSVDKTDDLLRGLTDIFRKRSRLVHFGCKLFEVKVTPALREFLKVNEKLKVFEVWSDQVELDPNFLFDMIKCSGNLQQIMIHCDQYDKPFMRQEIELLKMRKVKKIEFFTE